MAEGGPARYDPTPSVPVRKRRREREGRSKERDGKTHKSKDRNKEKKHRRSKSKNTDEHKGATSNVLDDLAKPAATKKTDPDMGNLEESKFN